MLENLLKHADFSQPAYTITLLGLPEVQLGTLGPLMLAVMAEAVMTQP